MPADGVMGNYYQALIQTTGVTLAPSTESSPALATNVLDWAHPAKYWMTTTTASDGTLVFDMGASPPSCIGLYLGRFNVASGVRLQANATNTWGSPSIDNALTFTTDSFVNRIQGLFFFNTDRSAITHRYYRLKIPSGTAVTDGASGFKVSLALPLVSPVEVTNRPQFRLTVRRAMARAVLPGGEEQRAALSVRQAILEMPWEWMWDPTLNAVTNEESTMLSLAQDEDDPVVVCRNLNKPHQAYLCRREGEIALDSSEGIGANFPLRMVEIL